MTTLLLTGPLKLADVIICSTPTSHVVVSNIKVLFCSSDVKKKQSIVKFNPANKVDFTKGTKVSVYS